MEELATTLDLKVMSLSPTLGVEITFKKKFFLSLFLKEKESVSGGGAERERETQNQKWPPGSELSAQSLTQGFNSQTARS